MVPFALWIGPLVLVVCALIYRPALKRIAVVSLLFVPLLGTIAFALRMQTRLLDSGLEAAGPMSQVLQGLGTAAELAPVLLVLGYMYAVLGLGAWAALLGVLGALCTSALQSMDARFLRTGAALCGACCGWLLVEWLLPGRPGILPRTSAADGNLFLLAGVSTGAVCGAALPSVALPQAVSPQTPSVGPAVRALGSRTWMLPLLVALVLCVGEWVYAVSLDHLRGRSPEAITHFGAPFVVSAKGYAGRGVWKSAAAFAGNVLAWTVFARFGMAGFERLCRRRMHHDGLPVASPAHATANPRFSGQP